MTITASKVFAVVLGSAIAVAFVVGAFVAPTADAAYVFTRNLTVGSTGTDVMELQKVLNSNPATVIAATGAGSPGMESTYFGALTKAAVVKFQISKGISGTGYVGPLTIAALNAVGPVAGLPAGCTSTTGYSTTTGLPCSTTGSLPAGCVAGAAYSSTTGQPCVPSTVTPTTGVEGTISVTQSNAGLPSSIYEGDSQVGVLAFKVDAKNSNVTVQRVKIDLGTNTSIYNKKFSRIYVTEGSTVLASSDLNSGTVVKEDSNYYITLTGMNLIVPKDGSKTLTIKVDVKDSVDSTYRAQSSTFRLATDGVRGVDGAGLNQYAGTTSVSRTISTISTDLIDSATLKVSLHSSTPKSAQVIASAGTNEDEADKVSLLNFALRAEKDSVLVTDLTADISGTAEDNGNVTTAYLFDGSNEIANASVTGGQAAFTDIDLTVAKDSTRVLTVKVDIRNATGTKTVAAALTGSTGVTSENSIGDSITASGSASGETMTVTNSGAVITLLSKSTSTSKTTDQSGNATTTLTATFRYSVTANGSDVVLGSVASTTHAFASSSSFVVYKNGAPIAQSAAPTIAGVSFENPDTGVTVANNSITIADGNTAEIVVNVWLAGTTALGTHSYAIQTAALNVNNQLVTFMNGQSAWRTSAVTLP